MLQAFPGNLKAKQSLETLGIRASDNKSTTVLDEHLKELWVLFNTKAYDQVIDNAENILDNFPEAADVWNVLGISAVRMRRLDEAIEAFNKTIELKPNDSTGYINLGNIHAELNNFDSALDSFLQALSMKPDDSMIHFNKGRVLRHLGKFQQALDSYHRAIILNPKKLNFVKGKLAKNLNTVPLFDTKRYAFNFERDLQEAYKRFVDGKNPANIFVKECD